LECRRFLLEERLRKARRERERERENEERDGTHGIWRKLEEATKKQIKIQSFIIWIDMFK